MGELITVAQAADELGITRQRVYRLIKKGQLPVVIIAGHKFVRPEALGNIVKGQNGRPRKNS